MEATQTSPELEAATAPELELETCGACQKAYAPPRGLAKHLARQPLCARWAALQSSDAVASYVEAKFRLPHSEAELEHGRNTCGICGTAFANTGNLNRHLKASVACAKWAMYRELKPLGGYIDSRVSTAFKGPEVRDPWAPPDHYRDVLVEDDGSVYFKDIYPVAVPVGGSKPAPVFIIWSLFLAEKELELGAALLSEHNIKYVIAILPSADKYEERVKVEVEHHVMLYEGHTPAIDFAEYREQCLKIDAVRQPAGGGSRGNTLVFCHNGYQRSLPFLVFYLVEYHRNEVPTVRKALEIVLGATDRSWIMNRVQFDEAVLRIETLLAPGLSSGGGTPGANPTTPLPPGQQASSP